MGTENRYYFGPVRKWVNTGLPVSFRTNNTVIDTCVVLSPYTSKANEVMANSKLLLDIFLH